MAVKIGRTSVSFKHVCGSDDLQNSFFTMSCLLCASRLAELVFHDELFVVCESIAELVFLSNTFVAARIGRTSLSFKLVCGSEDWQN